MRIIIQGSIYFNKITGLPNFEPGDTSEVHFVEPDGFAEKSVMILIPDSDLKLFVSRTDLVRVLRVLEEP